MDIRQSLAVSDLNVSHRAIGKPSGDRIRNASQVAQHIYAQAQEQGVSVQGTPELWQRDWMQSERFVLLDLPLHFAACPSRPKDQNKVLECLRASADSIEPIVVDVNKKKLGIASSGYYPPVIVIDGSYRHTAALQQGHETIKAWVGELAAEAMCLSMEYKPIFKKKSTEEVEDMQASMEHVAQKFRKFQATSIEAAMQIFGAAGGGMGGPGSSLGNGSGPGPTMVMKPTATPGSTGMKPPTMHARKRKMKAQSPESSGGYQGYKRASDKQSQRTKGGTKSEMAKHLKGSGYFGYTDATDKEQQRMKAPKKSEFEDPKTRNKSFSSAPDVGPGVGDLKGAAAKVARIVTKYKAALKSGYQHAAHELQAVAPPGMESTVKGLKRHFPKGSASPFKLAWYIHNKKKSKQMAADVDINRKSVDLHERPPKKANPAVGV